MLDMSDALSEQDVHQRFIERYSHVESDLVKEIERSVCGCDYGATSWTTVDEIQLLIELMGLCSDSALLEVGAGAGWPGLLLTEKTDCKTTLTDLPLQGLTIAKKRAVKDGLDNLVAVIVATGNLLPFRDESFDVMFHSDVLCCLPDKRNVLTECRRCVRMHGCMVFPVIFPAPDLSASDYQLALDGGPPFVEVERPYPELLAQTGWKLTDQIDLSKQFAKSLGLMNEKLEQHRDKLESLMGQKRAQEERANRLNEVEAAAKGILRRELYRAVPVS